LSFGRFSAVAAALASSNVDGSFTFFFSNSSRDVPEGRHDVPRQRVGLAADDGHGRNGRGRFTDVAFDLTREAGEIEQLAHAGETSGRARLELADVGCVLVLDGRHVLRLHVLEREVLHGHLGAVLLRPALRGSFDGLVRGLDVGLEDPEAQVGALLDLRRGNPWQRERRRGADGTGQETSTTEPSITHRAPPSCRSVEIDWGKLPEY